MIEIFVSILLFFVKWFIESRLKRGNSEPEARVNNEKTPSSEGWIQNRWHPGLGLLQGRIKPLPLSQKEYEELKKLTAQRAFFLKDWSKLVH